MTGCAANSRDNPATHVTVLHLPAGNPPPEAVSQLVRELEEQHDRSVVPVRVFWMPDSRTSTRSALAGLLAGRDPYRPKESRQRRILRDDPSRARVVAGEPAKVSELLQKLA